VNAINREGRGALVLAVLSNSETTVWLLIEHSADIATTDSKGKMSYLQQHITGLCL
jgi:hypothetical protein